MSGKGWSILSLAGSLFLAALAVVFSNSLPYAITLLVVAFLLVIGTVLWSAWNSFPRVFTDSKRPQDVARDIYRMAAQEGGTIHATHIFPVIRKPEDDYAVIELGKCSDNVEIVFHRVLLLDSIEDEGNWLRVLFEKLGKNVSKRFYTLSSYPLLLPRIAKAVLPRLNLILYQSPNGRSCRILVGLDRLHLDLAGDAVNFAFVSRDRMVYRVLLRYFEKITGSPHFRCCNSFEEHVANQPASTVVQRGQSVIARVVDFAETTPGIVYVGLFGSIARAALGLTASGNLEAADPDVDLIIVYDPHSCENGIEDVHTKIEDALGRERTNIVWGPDLDVFYPFRDEGRINIDIECLEAGTDFYTKNKLLGYSVFRYFMPLYTVGQVPLVNHIKVPIEPLTISERWALLVSDRQGLSDFRRRIVQTPEETDPRRLVSHIFRNLVWAETGFWPVAGKDASVHANSLNGWRNEKNFKEASELLTASPKSICKNLSKSFNIAGNLVDCVLKYAEEKHGER